MLDLTVGECIADAFKRDLDFLSGLNATYNILVGRHYELFLEGREDNKGGKKGALDYLILPLVARKLISDSRLNERRTSGLANGLANMVAWSVAVPLELARFTAAFALTLLLAPVVALVHLVKACMPKQEPYMSASTSSVKLL